MTIRRPLEISDEVRDMATRVAQLGSEGFRMAPDLHRIADDIAALAGADLNVTEGTTGAGPAGATRNLGAPHDEVFDEDEDEDESYDEDEDDEADDEDEDGPRSVLLYVRRLDEFPISADDARAAVEVVRESIADAVDTTADHLIIGTVTVDPDAYELATVEITTTEDWSSLGLIEAGFEAVFPLVGVGEVRIAASAERTIASPGPNPANAALDAAGRETGNRPQSTGRITVTYTRCDGQIFTDEQVRAVIDHPISQHGLAEFGRTVLFDIAAQPDDQAVKVVTFGIVEEGSIDPATLALHAVRYQGVVDFGAGLGKIRASASAELADATPVA